MRKGGKSFFFFLFSIQKRGGIGSPKEKENSLEWVRKALVSCWPAAFLPAATNPSFFFNLKQLFFFLFVLVTVLLLLLGQTAGMTRVVHKRRKIPSLCAFISDGPTHTQLDNLRAVGRQFWNSTNSDWTKRKKTSLFTIQHSTSLTARAREEQGNDDCLLLLPLHSLTGCVAAGTFLLLLFQYIVAVNCRCIYTTFPSSFFLPSDV